MKELIPVPHTHRKMYSTHKHNGYIHLYIIHMKRDNASINGPECYKFANKPNLCSSDLPK